MKEVDFLKKAVEIASISGDEEDFAKFLFKKMKDLGFEVSKDEAGNIIGEIGEGRPVLLLSSHMDTVGDTLPVKKKDGKLYGRGAVDAKGSLISMVCAAARFIEKKLAGKIIVAGIVEEEISVKGIDALLGALNYIDYAVFGEPSGLNRICVASKGRIQLHLTLNAIKGALHVSAGESGENPIHIAINVWKQLFISMKKKPFVGKTAYFSVEPNITIIKGGKATNTLPESCEVDIDLRFPPGITVKQILHEVDKIVASFHKYTKIQIKSEVLSRIAGFRAGKNTKIAKALKKAIGEITGSEAKFLRKSGTNFMSIIARRFRIPVVSYGPGNPNLDHTPNEHIDLEEFQRAIDVLEKFISYLIKEVK